MKTGKQLERHFKGVANHRRIEIIFCISRHEGVTVGDLASLLNCNFKTISEHTRRLVQAGLVNKTYKNQTVNHSLSPYGKNFVKFLKSL